MAGNQGGSGSFQERRGTSRSSPGTSRSSPGRPRSSTEMTPASFRKIGKLRSRVRLVSPKGSKIAQVGSLARWKRLFPAILWMRGLSDYLSRLPDRLPVSLVPRFWWNPVESSGLILVGFSLPGASRDKQECSRSVQEASGAARGVQEKHRSERWKVQKNQKIECQSASGEPRGR